MVTDSVTYVLAGDADYVTDSSVVLRARNIGSCVAIAAVDPAQGVGGILHALLPDARIDPFSSDSLSFNPYKYIPTGIPLFLRHIFDMGAEHRTLRVFTFGGYNLLAQNDQLTFGQRNIVAVRRVLWQEGVLIHRQRLGGGGPLHFVQLDMDQHMVTTFHRKLGRTEYGT